ncbi:SGNH/GDSL hydrolase family protein [Agriterribacter sp.]|mgnify:CR=1 FL=1|uniref:SGNH/GDSL hydrolase family protein n=1 Tax=Agriterribacter sp. TaxID=2821509 RepID=UPI002C8CD8D7|nr:SGNH/GDSL hydrolase family protein [Agriterribacter sp.]HRP58267.1 SGNH/GDSL hydrolase family protein [Agriterribacter sp.]
MKNLYLLLALFFLSSYQAPVEKEIADPATYLDEIKASLKKEWPDNHTINLVFHGHSVPAGYFKTPVVNTLEAYPYQVLKALKAAYPYAVINIINTSIGGENSESGSKRFAKDVLIHKPDVLFIDYALNDRGIGLDKSKSAWEAMIRQALEKNIKIILLTPSPDTSVHISEPGNVLEKHALQIRSLAKKYSIGLANSYAAFKQVADPGNDLNAYMSQINHPNEKGHALIAEAILRYFIN